MPNIKSKTKKQIEDIDLHDSLNKIKNVLLETSGDVKERGIEMLNNLIEKFQNKKNDYQHDLEENITESPYKSMGVALAIGFLAAKFVF